MTDFILSSSRYIEFPHLLQSPHFCTRYLEAIFGRGIEGLHHDFQEFVVFFKRKSIDVKAEVKEELDVTRSQVQGAGRIESKYLNEILPDFSPKSGSVSW